jgi:hypothetical protein
MARPLFRPKTYHTCHQKPNPSRMTVPLSAGTYQIHHVVGVDSTLVVDNDAGDLYFVAGNAAGEPRRIRHCANKRRIQMSSFTFYKFFCTFGTFHNSSSKTSRPRLFLNNMQAVPQTLSSGLNYK